MDAFQTVKPETRHKEGGQAMVEYALIAAFVVIAFAVTLAATGPAIGNVFSNVIYGVVGQAPGEAPPDITSVGGPGAFWATVTWVAANPQLETAYPAGPNLPDRPTSTPFTAPTASDTGTATWTPTQTNTPTPSPTMTEFVPTAGPSQTPEDKEFRVPFADRADLEMNWRLDRSFVLNVGGWTGYYYNSSTCPDPDDGSGVPADTTLIRYDWAAGSPDAAINADGFVGCWTNTFNLNQTINLRFVAPELAGGTLTVTLDGASILSANAAGDAAIQTITAGEHTLKATYTHSSGDAQVYLLIERPSQNPDDTTTVAEGCPWGMTSDNVQSGSPMNVFDNDPGPDGNPNPAGPVLWPNGQTCVLELRGWINSAAAPNPKLSFWDVWDFTGASGISARLEVANYVESSPSVLDRSVWASPEFAINDLRTGGSANYNWTRTEVDLSTVSGLSDKWTFRFVLTNTSGSDQFIRWYIDDIQVVNDPTPSRTFTVLDVWDLNSRSQMADFIFNADANYTREQSAGSPPSSEWRWNLTTDRARNGTAWALKDYAPSAAPSDNGLSTNRVYYLELRYPIDVSATRNPAVPAADYDGDTGVPILSFWQAYVGAATREVEYALLSDPNNWITADYLEPLTPAPLTTMQRNSVLLPTTEPFRLRFKLSVDQSVPPQPGDGWYIDDILIERDLGSPYASYPFVDSAESEAFTRQNWTTANTWAATTLVGGVKNSGTSYTDSPGTGVNYPIGTESRFEMRRVIDLLSDTPENPDAGGTAATAPMLTFWMRRDLQGTFSVDLWTDAGNHWTTAWNLASSGARTQNGAWERVEIDLGEAIRVNNGTAWANIGSGSTADDDIKIRFSLLGAGTTAFDGIYIDGISIADKEEVVHRLSTDGVYRDSIESNSRGLLLEDAWHLGGTWNWTNDPAHLYNGTLALADSPLLNYQPNWTAIAEMQPVFDLTGITAAQLPSLNFFTRFALADGDTFSVEIATPQTGGLQQYDDLFGWSAWTPAQLYPTATTSITNGITNTMHRWRVKLDSYAGQRIRIRFVLRTDGAGTPADGVTIDEVSLTYGINAVTSLPANASMTLSNWILEGRWNATSEFASSATDSGLGSAPWYGLFFDCETLRADVNAPCEELTSFATYEQILNAYPLDPFDTSATLPAGITRPTQNGTSTVLDLWLSDIAMPDLVGDNTPYLDTFAARWTRNVVLAANQTYRFYAISNAGMRVSLSVNSGFTPTLPTINSKFSLINAWNPHGNQLDVRTIQVGNANVSAVLTVEFYDTGGNSVASLTSVSQNLAFSDSPNTLTGGSYTPVLSARYGNSALTYANFINNSGGGKRLNYSLLWNFSPDTTFTMETSTDGGFTWTPAQTIASGGSTSVNMLPAQEWSYHSIPLPTGPYVTFRFRLDTRTRADNVTGDGVWISGIEVP